MACRVTCALQQFRANILLISWHSPDRSRRFRWHFLRNRECSSSLAPSLARIYFSLSVFFRSFFQVGLLFFTFLHSSVFYYSLFFSSISFYFSLLSINQIINQFSYSFLFSICSLFISVFIFFHFHCIRKFALCSFFTFTIFVNSLFVPLN